MSGPDFIFSKWRRIIVPGGKGQGSAVLLALINGILFAFVILPFLIAHLGLRPIDTVGEHYWMVPGLLDGRGLAWGIDTGITFMMAKEPGYTFLLAAIYKIFGTLDARLIQSVQVLLNASICWMVWSIGYLSTSRRSVATVAAVCYAFHPLALLYSARIWNDIPSSFWITLSIWLFLLTLRDGSIVKGALAGGTLAIAALFRTASFGLLFVLAIWLVMAPVTLSANDRIALWSGPVRRVKIASAMIIAFFLVLSPWAVRNYLLSGRPVLLVTIQSWATWIDGGQVVRLWNVRNNVWPKETEVKKFALIRRYHTEVQQADGRADNTQVELRVHHRLRSAVLTEIRRDPLGYGRRVAASSLLFWYLGTHRMLSYGMLLINLILIPFAVAATIFALRRRSAYLLILASIGVYFWLVYAMVVGYCRYSVPTLPYVLILAAFASVRMYDTMQIPQRKAA